MTRLLRQFERNVGLELLQTIKAYLEEDKMHLEVVFLVAMVTVAR